jgi:hypothetical protein
MPTSFEIIQSDITTNRRFSKSKVYVIASEVRVRKGVRVIIEDGTTILIMNGLKPKCHLLRAALIFDQGSILRAKRFYVKACNASYRQVKQADNGGLWFLGNYQDASKDKLTIKANRKTPPSSFQADLIATYYLGRLDPMKKTTRTKVVNDDIDGLSVLGVSQEEWSIKEIRSFNSGDDGFDVTNSHIRLDRLKVINPTEDGINLSSSRLEVARSLVVDVTKTKVTDRDIFDFETDDGASYLEIAQHCHIDIRGVFGDELVLSAKDLPRPNNNPEARYKFKGVTRKAAALVYSINLD